MHCHHISTLLSLFKNWIFANGIHTIDLLRFFGGDIDNIKIIINAGILETKSKLTSLFEKKNNHVCIPTYTDNN